MRGVTLDDHRAAGGQRRGGVATGHREGEREVAGAEHRDRAERNGPLPQVGTRERACGRAAACLDAHLPPAAVADQCGEQAQLADRTGRLASHPRRRAVRSRPSPARSACRRAPRCWRRCSPGRRPAARRWSAGSRQRPASARAAARSTSAAPASPYGGSSSAPVAGSTARNVAPAGRTSAAPISELPVSRSGVGGQGRHVRRPSRRGRPARPARPRSRSVSGGRTGPAGRPMTFIPALTMLTAYPGVRLRRSQ